MTRAIGLPEPESDKNGLNAALRIDYSTYSWLPVVLEC